MVRALWALFAAAAPVAPALLNPNTLVAPTVLIRKVELFVELMVIFVPSLVAVRPAAERVTLS